jgi:hypothetical protein
MVKDFFSLTVINDTHNSSEVGDSCFKNPVIRF